MKKMKDSGIPWLGAIPEEWNVFKVKNIVFRKSDKDMPDEQVLSLYRELGIVIKSERDDNHNVTSENTSNYKFVRVNDLVVNKMKAWQGSIAVSGYQGIVSPAYYVYQFKNNKVYPWYVHYVLRCKAYLPEYRRLSGGIRLGQWDLSDENFKNIPLPIPNSYDEQKRIADYLDKKCAKIDSIIEKQQAIIEKLKEYKLSFITETVTKGLDVNTEMKDSGISWMGNVPKHWTESTVYRCISFEGGSQPALEYFEDEYKEGLVRLIQNRDYRTDDYITYVPRNMVSKFCDVDDVMIGRYGPPIFVLHRGLEGAYNVALMKAVPLCLDREYMFFYLQNTTMLAYITSFSLRSAGQSGVNPKILKKFPMFVPPMDEQINIAKELHRKTEIINTRIGKSEQLISKLKEYRQSLIYEVVTGKKEV